MGMALPTSSCATQSYQSVSKRKEKGKLFNSVTLQTIAKERVEVMILALTAMPSDSYSSCSDFNVSSMKSCCNFSLQ